MKYTFEIELVDEKNCKGCPIKGLVDDYGNYCCEEINITIGRHASDLMRPSTCPLKPMPSCSTCKFWAEHRCIFRIESESASWFCANWEGK